MAVVLLPLCFFAAFLVLQTVGINSGGLYVVLASAFGLYTLYFAPKAFGVDGIRKKDPSRYVSFVILLWLFSPFVRRYGDSFTGWSELNVYGLAPLVVSCICLAFIRFRRSDFDQFGKYFVFLVVAVLYGYFVGVLNVGFVPATYAFLNWIVPILLGFFIAINYRFYSTMLDAIYWTIVIGMLLMGGYGIYQFVVLPEWDAIWISNVRMTSVGQPFPMGMRVFSTMNAPMVFAPVIAMCMILVLARSTFLGVVAHGLGFVALILTLVRAAWGGYGLSVLIYLLLVSRKSPRMIVSVVAGGMVLAAAFYVFLAFVPAGERIFERFDTVSSLSDDTSFSERQVLYQRNLEYAIGSVVGDGLGALGVAQMLGADAENAVLAFDSGLLQFPISLGWFGTFLYGYGLFYLMRIAFLLRKSYDDPFQLAYVAILSSVFVQMIFANRMIAPIGIFFFVFLGLAVASAMYGRCRISKNRA